MVDIRDDAQLCEIINHALNDGKILELRNLPRKDVPMNVCVVELGRKVLTRRRDGAADETIS